MSVTQAQRDHLHRLMHYLISKEPLIGYQQYRPMTTIHYNEAGLRRHLDSGHSISMDCSESVTLLCKLAGLKDPNGFGYNGYGYTGTLLNHLPHYSRASNAHVGAIAIFGAGTGEHAVMVMERGSDPVVFSHGFSGGPLALRLSTEKRYHPGARVTFLDISHLG